jgi:predicted PurR-regulated permease PerM
MALAGSAAPGLEVRPRSVIAAVLVLGALFVVWKIRFILLLLFAGSLGALVLSELVTRLQKALRVRRSIAVGMVLLIFGTTVGLTAWFRGPAILQQIHEIQSDLPASAHRVASLLGKSEWGRWAVAQVLDPEQLSKAVGMALAGLGGAITTTAATVGGAFIIVFITIYLGAEPDRYKRGLLRITPAAAQAKVQACIERAIHNLRYWIFAKTLSMCAIGALVTTGLWWLDIPLAGTLGAFAALMTFVPNLGPVLSVIPAALLAFALSPTRGVIVLGLFALAHFLEGNLVTPLAERNIVKLPPVLTLSVQLVLATLTGFAGVALAAPLTAVLLGIAQTLRPPTGPVAHPNAASCDVVQI